MRQERGQCRSDPEDDNDNNDDERYGRRVLDSIPDGFAMYALGGTLEAIDRPPGKTGSCRQLQ